MTSWPAEASATASNHPLHSTGANAEFARNLQDAGAFGPSLDDLLLDLGTDTRTAQPLAFLAGARQSSLHTRHDHCSLELAEHTHHLEHGLAGRRRCVQCLLMEVEIHALGSQFVEEGDKVSQRAAKTINRPGGDQIEIPPRHTPA